jgi:hypothetical protein
MMIYLIIVIVIIVIVVIVVIIIISSSNSISSIMIMIMIMIIIHIIQHHHILIYETHISRSEFPWKVYPVYILACNSCYSIDDMSLISCLLNTGFHVWAGIKF